jgi:hypothetical protein
MLPGIVNPIARNGRKWRYPISIPTDLASFTVTPSMIQL